MSAGPLARQFESYQALETSALHTPATASRYGSRRLPGGCVKSMGLAVAMR